MEHVKCGEKGRHLDIPEGWRKLGDQEIAGKGDRVANIRDIKWMSIEDDELGLPAIAVGDHVIRLKDETRRR